MSELNGRGEVDDVSFSCAKRLLLSERVQNVLRHRLRALLFSAAGAAANPVWLIASSLMGSK
eukprot:354518-Chlamydomonas_euryale.AAC.4